MKSRLLIATFIGSVFISTCSKEPLCRTKSGNEGIITANVNELEDNCFNFGEKQFLIRSDSEYNAVIQVNQFSPNCKTKTLPFIDFNENSLLSCFADAGGCEAGMVRRAERDDNNKKITYTVETYGCGNCEMLMVSQNIVLIPKVPDDYSVEFNVIEK